MVIMFWITAAVISAHLVWDFFNVGRELAQAWNRGT